MTVRSLISSNRPAPPNRAAAIILLSRFLWSKNISKRKSRRHSRNVGSPLKRRECRWIARFSHRKSPRNRRSWSGIKSQAIPNKENSKNSRTRLTPPIASLTISLKRTKGSLGPSLPMTSTNTPVSLMRVRSLKRSGRRLN